jgi:hypothetical protein
LNIEDWCPTRCSLGGIVTVLDPTAASCPTVVTASATAWGSLHFTSALICTILVLPWGSTPPNCMQRTIARFLLLLAVAGNLTPLALAVTATPPHACCLRKAHHCHSSADSNPSTPAFRSADCCRQSCSHAVITTQWAYPQPQAGSLPAHVVRFRFASHFSSALSTQSLSPQSTRAPPRFVRL